MDEHSVPMQRDCCNATDLHAIENVAKWEHRPADEFPERPRERELYTHDDQRKTDKDDA